MPPECLIAEFSDESNFRTALEVLEKSHYSERDVSIVTKAEEIPESAIDDAKDTTPASPPAGKTTGAATVAGGTLGAMIGTATLIGPLMLAGPILGMAAGAAGGGVLASIESWGVRHEVGQRYEQRVRQGSRLIVVTGDDVKLSEAEQLLKTCGPGSLQRFEH